MPNNAKEMLYCRHISEKKKKDIQNYTSYRGIKLTSCTMNN